MAHRYLALSASDIKHAQDVLATACYSQGVVLPCNGLKTLFHGQVELKKLDINTHAVDIDRVDELEEAYWERAQRDNQLEHMTDIMKDNPWRRDYDMPMIGIAEFDSAPVMKNMGFIYTADKKLDVNVYFSRLLCGDLPAQLTALSSIVDDVHEKTGLDIGNTAVNYRMAQLEIPVKASAGLETNKAKVSSGLTLADAWETLVYNCLKNGRIRETGRATKKDLSKHGRIALSLINGMLVAREPLTGPMLSNKVDTDTDFCEIYAMKDVILPHKKPDQTYSYGERLNEGDQLNRAIKRLEKERLESDDGFLPVEVDIDLPIARPYDMDPSQPSHSDPPCLRYVGFVVNDEGKLDLNGYFRSWAAFDGAPVNIFGLARLQEDVAKQSGFEPGSLTVFHKSAQLRQQIMENKRVREKFEHSSMPTISDIFERAKKESEAVKKEEQKAEEGTQE